MTSLPNTSEEDSFRPGLCVVHRPNSSQPSKVDIVAVHGIHDHDFSCWSREDKSSSSEFEAPGLLNLLPERFPMARVMTFGYRTEPSTGGLIQAPILRQLAIELLASLTANREVGETSPIVFMGHNLGGVIIKELLWVANNMEIYFPVAASTKLLVFFGTPHFLEEPKDCSWMDLMFALTLASNCPAREDRQIFTALIQTGLNALLAASGRFEILSKHYQHINIFETQKTPRLDELIVPETSAILEEFEAPDEDQIRSLNLGRNKDHMGLCRFSSSSDPVFETLGGEIERLLKATASSTEMESYMALIGLRAAILMRYSEIPNAPMESPAPDTLQWATPQLLDTSDEFIHVVGSPGSGKSVLCSYLKKQSMRKSSIDSTAPAVTLSFCFSRSNNRRRSAEDLVGSFLLQALARYSAKLKPKTVRTMFAVVGMVSEQWSLDTLWGLLHAILDSQGEITVLCIIDGLEDCNESVEQLLRYMADTRRIPVESESETEYKFIFTSRPTDRIDSIFKQIQEEAELDETFDVAFLRFDLDSEPDVVTDKEHFIDERKKNTAYPSVLGDLEHELNKRSFLELTLILDKLLDPETPPEAKESIKGAMGSKLENGVLISLYETFLSEIPPQEQAWAGNVLSWLVFAQQPLTIKQLSVALAVDCYPVSSTHTWKVERLIRPNFEVDLHYALGKLVRVEGHEVYLAHPTVREFLIARGMENRIAIDCLRYIGFQNVGWEEVLQVCEIPPQLRLPNSRLPSHEFLAYATLHWATSLRQSNNNDKAVAQALSFLRSGSTAVASWGEAYWALRKPAANQIKPCWDQPLQVAAHLGLTGVVNMLLAEDPNQDKRQALQIAVQAGHEDITQILLNYEPSHWGSVLFDACMFSHTSIVELVLQAGQTSLPPLEQCLFIAAERSCSKIACRLIDELIATETDAENRLNNVRSPSGDTPLILAARLGNEVIVKKLLENGADKSAVNGDNHTALHVAASCGHLSVVRALLQEMVETDHENKAWDFHPLHLAAQYGYDTVVKALLDGTGVDSDTKAESYGFTPLHLAASCNHPKVAEILLELNADNSPVDKQGFTPLIIASAAGYLEVVEVLLEQFADTEVTVRGVKSRTALHFAAVGGYAAVVQALLDDGANQDAVTVPQAETALHEAITSGHLEVVQILLEEGVDVDLQQFEGLTALHIGAREGNVDVVKSLLENFADPDLPDAKGRTAIQIAAESEAPGAPEVLQLLLDAETDASPGELAEKTKVPALILAALTDNMRLLELAIEEDSNVESSKRPSDGSTALHIAARNGYYNLARKLLGMKNGSKYLELHDNAGRSALHVAAEAGHASLDVMKLLLTHKADIEARTTYHQTALHIAIANDNESMAEFLIDSGADVNTESFDDLAKLFTLFRRSDRSFKDSSKIVCEKHAVTPLHMAAQQGNEKIVRRLLDKGANILARATDGSTALHLAIQRQHYGTCQILLDNGGNITQSDGRSPTALFMAAYHGNPSILALFPRTDLSASPQLPCGLPCGYWGSPFQAALLGGHQAALQIFSEILAENPMMALSQDAHGWTPLHCISRSAEMEGALDAAIAQQYPAFTPMQRPNPTMWSTEHRNPFIQLDGAGVEATCPEIASSVPAHNAAIRTRHFCIQADHPFSGRIYFEVLILSKAIENEIGIGLSSGICPLDAMPGWGNFNWWGYHGDDGMIYNSDAQKARYETFGEGDIVGCGVNKNGSLYFTKNGKKLGTPLRGISGQLFPVIGMAMGARSKANFGPRFEYNFHDAEQDDT